MELSLGEGHGIEGHYLGLPDPFANEATSKVVIVPVAFDKTTTYQHGTEKGPAALIEASRNLECYDIETDSEVYKEGIHTSKEIAAKTSEEMLKQTYDRVLNYVKKGKFVVTLGGEHSISYAPIKAHAEAYQGITVVQFDAHADLQKAYEGNPWSHASVMARVKELPNVKKIVSIGIRSMSAEELPLLDKENTFFAHKIANDPSWIEKVLDKVSGPVYITFDLDVFDSSLMSSTGTPEPGGLQWNDVMKILRPLIQRNQLIGCDVVELCPKENNPAPDFLAAKLLYKILSYHFTKELS